MDELSAIVLAGGRGSRLKSLTRDKSKSYVSFLGKYRIIDFPLSSISYSKIKETGIITQYEPYDLIRYIGSGEAWDLNYQDSGISFLTPFEANNSKELVMQKGTANAILSQIEFIKRSSSKYFVILSGDQIYKMDFNKVLKFHIKNNSDLTIITQKYYKDDLSRFGIAEVDENNRIISFKEKPLNPKSNIISLGIYLFNKDVLIKYLEYATTLVDFGSDLIPYIIEQNNNVYSYNYDGLFMDLGTIESLYQGNMYFLDNLELLNAEHKSQKIYSRPLYYTPMLIKKESSIKNSIISDGTLIKGEIVHSIISVGSTIDLNSKIIDSVIMPNVIVGKNVIIKNCVVDESITIPDNTVLDFDTITLIDNEYLRNKNV